MQLDVGKDRIAIRNKSDDPVNAEPSAVICWGGDVNLGRRMHYRAAEVGAGKVLDLPSLKSADLAIVNLECVVSTKGEPHKKPREAGPYYFRARPEMLEILHNAGIGMVAVANNHAGDYGNEALRDQQLWLQKFAIGAAGFGENVDLAFQPAFKTVGDLKLALIAIDATCRDYAATKDSPGIAYVDPHSPETWSQHLGPSIRSALDKANVVLVAAHWGDNWEKRPGEAQRALGHYIIDTGAHGILGSSAHVLQSIELYKGRPILHDAGDFLFDSKLGDRSSGFFKLDVDREGISNVAFVPVNVKFGQTVELLGDEAARATAAFQNLCGELGCPMTIEASGHGSVVLRDTTSGVRREREIGKAGLLPAAKHPSLIFNEETDEYRVDTVPNGVMLEKPLEIGPLRLLGFHCKSPRITGRQMLWFDSYWSSDESLAHDWRIDFKVASEDGKAPVIWGASMDHDPCDWMLPTSRWQPRDIYRDVFGLRPPDQKTLRDAELQISVRLVRQGQKTDYVQIPGARVMLQMSTNTNSIPSPPFARRALPAQKRVPLDLDDLNISFLNVDINWQRTGVEVASLLRCKLFAEQLGIVPNILTSKFNAHLQDVASELRIRKIVPPQTTIFSMYDYLQGALASDLHEYNTAKLLTAEHNANEEWRAVPNTSDYRVFDRNGRRIKYVARNPVTGKVHYVNHFHDDKKWRRDNYDSRGFLSRIQYLDEGSGHVLREHYLRADGRPALGKVYLQQAKPGTLDYIEILDPAGRLQKKVKTEDELIEFWLNQFVSRDDRKHLFFVDKSRMLYDPAINVRDVQADQQKLMVIPVVHALHTRDHTRPGQGDINRNYTGVLRDVKRPDGIIVLTEAQKGDIVERFGEANIHVIGHAHESQATPQKFAERDRLKVVYMARYSPEKNHLMAIRAFRRVVDEIPEANLHCYGFGNAGDPTLPAMEKLILKLGLQANVFLHGFAQETADIYEGAGLAILTSQSESYSLTVMESLYHGCPVVSFDILYGPRDLIRDGYNGYLVPFANEEAFADKVLAILANPDLHETLSNQARSDGRRFSFECKALEWKNLLRERTRLRI